MLDIKGSVALVTGGSRGIGRGIALALARAGADVVVNYVSRRDEADKVVSEIATFGRRAIAVQANISVEADVVRLAAESRLALGPVSILVNNAGILGSLPESGLVRQEWDKVINTNLKSAFLVTEEILPMMLEQRWGRIIFLSSIAAQIGGAAAPHYAASKAGILGMMHSYARRLLREGISVNAISPAYVETDMLMIGLHPEVDRVPVGRFGTLEEAGETAVLLARNGFITGQTINLNGGAYMS
jgi:3-oxoacyl-[acyl-carrier protein] reductase